ncbi:hypothetical protein ACLMJK_003304 [Lecanora helva]
MRILCTSGIRAQPGLLYENKFDNIGHNDPIFSLRGPRSEPSDNLNAFNPETRSLIVISCHQASLAQNPAGCLILKCWYHLLILEMTSPTPDRSTLLSFAAKGDLTSLQQHLSSSNIQSEYIGSVEILLPAIENNHPHLIPYLVTTLSVNPNDPLIQRAVVTANSLPIYQAIVPLGFNLNYDHGVSGGPLCWVRNDIPLATYLLKHGADPNRDIQTGRYQPLALAARNRQCGVEIVDLFIRYGAHIDRSGALIVAARMGFVEKVRLLLDRGADVGMEGWSESLIFRRQEEKESALHAAVREWHEEVVRVLLEN